MNELETLAETANFLVTSVPGRCEAIAIPGIRGRWTSVDHPSANLIGAARLDEDTADVAISEVVARFAAARKPFGWIVGPLSTPLDLAKRLRSNGLIETGSVVAVARDLNGPEPIPTSAFKIGIASSEDLPSLVDGIASAYRLSKEVAEFTLAISLARSELRPTVYCVFAPDGRPVSFLISSLFPGKRAVFFRAGGTLPEFRGRGMMTSLIAYGLHATQREGTSLVIAQANPRTSEGIVRQLGFRTICRFQMFVGTSRHRSG